MSSEKLPPLVKTIRVPCDQVLAFDIFIKDMNNWWPLGKYTVSAMTGKPAKFITVEARLGGKIVETTHDGREYLWGQIVAYVPYEYLSMEFHIPLPEEKVESRSLVEVRFAKLSDNETSVELRQSNWEAFGERAKMLQGGYGPGWGVIFEQCYKSACEARGSSLG